jgi:uncharacterized protein YcgI (DUF1989 family)
MSESTHTRASRLELVLLSYGDGDDAFTVLVDLIADAMHWCDATGQDFHIAFAQACRHYVNELNDEQHDERRIRP